MPKDLRQVSVQILQLWQEFSGDLLREREERERFLGDADGMFLMNLNGEPDLRLAELWG